MRFALRRGASAPDDETSAGPPRGPAATFAEVVDGHLLWVAVVAEPGRPDQPDGTAGRLGLRRTDSGVVVELTTEQVTDQSAHLGARLDLSALDGEEGRYDVVLERPEGGVEPLVTDPRGPAAVRPSLDGRTRYAVVRGPEGTLRVRATLLPHAAELAAVRVVPDGIELTLHGAGPELAILEEDARDPLVSWPVDERGVVVITPDSIGSLAALTRPAMTGTTGDWRPVRRRANDLVDPRAGAPLPQLDHPSGERPRLRLPWSREGMLQVRLFDLDLDLGEATGPDRTRSA